jgi:hypothetical protein
MFCPQCGARTEVNEKRGPFRDRRCTNAACNLDFTTREHVMPQRNRGRNCARTRATHIETPPRSQADGVEVGLTSCPDLGASSTPMESASGVQDEPEYQQAGVA